MSIRLPLHMEVKLFMLFDFEYDGTGSDVILGLVGVFLSYFFFGESGDIYLGGILLRAEMT